MGSPRGYNSPAPPWPARKRSKRQSWGGTAICTPRQLSTLSSLADRSSRSGTCSRNRSYSGYGPPEFPLLQILPVGRLPPARGRRTPPLPRFTLHARSHRLHQSHFLTCLDELFELEDGAIQPDTVVQQIDGWSSLTFM